MPKNINELFSIIEYKIHGFAMKLGDLYLDTKTNYSTKIKKKCFIASMESAERLSRFANEPLAIKVVEIDLDGFAIKFTGGIDLHYNVMDDGFSTYLHNNCFIETREEANELLETIKEDPERYIDRIVD